MAKKILKGILINGLIFFAVMIWRVVYLEVREIRLDNALEGYRQVFSEKVDLNASHKKELAELLIRTMRGTTSSEDAQISRKLSQIINENKAMDEKLAKAKQKFCDLAEEEEPLCPEKQEPAPHQGWSI